MPPDRSLSPDRTDAYTPPETTDQTAAGTTPPGGTAPADAPSIPGYAVTAELAKGGMGRVFAGHDRTLDREVAIKTLLPGASGERFVTESKIAARLPHPNIPPVHALGTLADGSPYLVMKLIRGRTLDALLKERASPADGLPRWVQVFEGVAHAVGFAHSRGVIHRDLKPANVMVGEFGEVQVMDWGLAKAGVGSQETGDGEVRLAAGRSGALPDDARAEFTQAGAVMGTPGYMAPEQARGEPVDARADVFALGATLAAILTGKPAFVGKTAVETIGRAAKADLADALSRLDGCGADAELVALAKGCLAANAMDRPADGRAVAADVAAYRAGVEARLRRAETERAEALVREAEERKRRRQFNRAAGVVAGALLLGVVGTSLGMWQANVAAGKERTANAAAQTAKRDADDSAAKEKDANQKTQNRLKQIVENVEQFAGLLSGLNPQAEELGGDPLYVQLRTRAEALADKLDAEAVGDPLAVARLQVILGNTLRELGNAAKAVGLLEKARATREHHLGPDDPDTLLTLHDLHTTYHAAGRRVQDLIPLAERLRDRQTARLGADHRQTLNTRYDLASLYRDAGRLPDAIKLYEAVRGALAAQLGEGHPDVLSVGFSLAGAYRAVGRVPEAVPLLESVRDGRAATLGADHPATLSALDSLASAYRAAGRVRDAVAVYESVRARQTRKYGAAHESTLKTTNNLAAAYWSLDRLPEAISLFGQVRDARQAALGPDHENTLTTTNNLAASLQAAGRLPEAIPLFERVLDRRAATLGRHHPDTISSLNNLAEAYRAAGRQPDALPLYRDAIDGLESHRFEHYSAAAILRNAAAAHEQVGQVATAEAWRVRCAGVVRSTSGPTSPAHAGELASLGLNLLRQNRWADAETPLRESLTVRERAQPDAWTTFNTHSVLGGALLGQKKYADAEPLLLKGYEGLKAREKDIPPAAAARIPEALDRLIELYAATGKPDEVRKYRALRAKYPTAAPPPRTK